MEISGAATSAIGLLAEVLILISWLALMLKLKSRALVRERGSRARRARANPAWAGVAR